MYTPRLLIVEDDIEVVKLLGSVLKGDYLLQFAQSGEEAWELLFFFGESFDLMTVDINLPGFNGLELLRKVRDINPWLPAIIMTGCSTQECAESAADIGVAGYINKPFTIEQLKGKLSRAVNQYRLAPLNNIAPKMLLGCSPRAFHPLTRRAIYEIHKKFNTTITVEEISVATRASKSHLSRVFKKDCQFSINEYLLKLRVEVAKELLSNSGYSAAIISELVGYKDRSYFFRIFKRETGSTPFEFRNESVSQ